MSDITANPPDETPRTRVLDPDSLFAKSMLGAFRDRGFILMVFPTEAREGDGLEYLTNCEQETVDLILGKHRAE